MRQSIESYMRVSPIIMPFWILKSIQGLPVLCIKMITAIIADNANNIAAEPEVPGANVSSMSVRRLIVAIEAAKYYQSIGRTMNTDNMHYNNVLSKFKINWDAHVSLKSQDAPDVQMINDKDGDRKVIKWVPIFTDCLARTYGAKVPLSYVLKEDEYVPAEETDSLDADAYYGTSDSLHDGLVTDLPHTVAIYKNDNTSVYMKIEKATRGSSVESTVQVFNRSINDRAAFQALIANHAGDTKYRVGTCGLAFVLFLPLWILRSGGLLLLLVVVLNNVLGDMLLE